jgi:hypothetical protein
MVTEPQVDDPTARGENDECEECGYFIFECICNAPDEMYGEMYED